MVCLLRPWEERHLIDQALEAMAAARPIEETLHLLVRIAEAETLDAEATILFDLDQRRRTLHSEGLSGVLAGELPDAGTAGDHARDHADDPWRELLAQPDPRVWAPYDLPAPLGQLAEAAGYRSCWAWPAVTNDQRVALFVAWRTEDRTDRDQSRMVAMERLARVAGLVLVKSRADAELAFAANHDPLTALANRARFFDEMASVVDPFSRASHTSQVHQARENEGAAPDGADGGRSVGVLALDLDGFKPVNDRFGHAAGDEILQLVAERIVTVVGDRGLAARLGGDEFVVAVHDAGPDGQLAETLADQLRQTLRAPYDTSLIGEVRISASIGVGTSTVGACTADELLDVADAALYRAKAEGRDRVCVDRGAGHLTATSGPRGLTRVRTSVEPG
jgi:diguanylate cyclase (GGDEF)-like protein